MLFFYSFFYFYLSGFSVSCYFMHVHKSRNFQSTSLVDIMNLVHKWISRAKTDFEISKGVLGWKTCLAAAKRHNICSPTLLHLVYLCTKFPEMLDTHNAHLKDLYEVALLPPRGFNLVTKSFQRFEHYLHSLKPLG